jgi:hypothetical protein
MLRPAWVKVKGFLPKMRVFFTRRIVAREAYGIGIIVLRVARPA